MARGRRIAAAVLMALTLSVAGAATAFALSLPGTTTTLTTPSVTVPPVSTPVATTPSVTVPSTTTKVTTPAVSAPPPGSKPTTVPKVTTPSATVKSGSTTVRVPSRTIGGTGGGGGSGSGPVSGTVKRLTGTLSSGSTSGPTGVHPGTTGGGRSGGGHGAGDSSTTPVSARLPGGPGGGLAGPGALMGSGSFAGRGAAALAFGIPPARGGPGRRFGGVDGFTAAVASLAGCFYSLSPFEQQVLIVRTGLDGRVPLSRSQLAAAVGTSPELIARTERGALRTLKRASLADGCVPVASASALTGFAGGPFGPIGPVTPALAPGSRIAPAGGDPAPTFASSSFTDRLSSVAGDGQSGPVWAALVIVALLATALAALGREWRRSVY
jgi:hypothetical protein